MARYKQVRARGTKFVFKYDDADDTILHIFARHLTHIGDVLDVYFDPKSEQQWNDERRRFERQNESHVLYWFELEKNVVMVITYFTREQNE